MEGSPSLFRASGNLARLTVKQRDLTHAAEECKGMCNIEKEKYDYECALGKG